MDWLGELLSCMRCPAGRAAGDDRALPVMSCVGGVLFVEPDGRACAIDSVRYTLSPHAELLRDAIADVAWSVSLTTALKCSPTCRAPRRADMLTCSTWFLSVEMETLQPSVVVCSGREAMRGALRALGFESRLATDAEPWSVHTIEAPAGWGAQTIGLCYLPRDAGATGDTGGLAAWILERIASAR